MTIITIPSHQHYTLTHTLTHILAHNTHTRNIHRATYRSNLSALACLSNFVESYHDCAMTPSYDILTRIILTLEKQI